MATTDIDSTDRIVSPGSLAAEVQQACADLRAAAAPDSTRLLEATIQLERLAVPVFNRTRAISAPTATALRIGSLCLAVEADTLAQHRSGTAFQQVATGISLLELRRNSQTPPTETNMLATV